MINRLPSMPAQYEIITAGKRLRYLDKNGRIYSRAVRAGVAADNLIISDDWCANWTTVYTGFNDYISRVEVLPDGAILVVLYGGSVQRSEDDGVTFTEVFQFPNAGRLSSWNCGFDVYDRFVLAAPYHDTTAPYIYFSNDYGKSGSWSTILALPDSRVYHPHDVKFDPYENLIWAVFGDVNPSCTAIYSDNFGKSWHKQKPKTQNRVTNIIPLPGCVMFGTDEIQVMGAYRHERPVKGTISQPVEPRLFWAARPASPEDPDGAPCWATKPAITYGHDGSAMAYWGYTQSPNQGFIPSAIYATDGNRVYTIWCQDKLPDAPDMGTNGILGVWGPTDNGVLLAMLYSYYGDSVQENFLKITLGTTT